MNAYDTCCTSAYSAYNYYTPVPAITTYYPGVYSAPYVSYYSPYLYRRYPSNRGPVRSGYDRFQPQTPAYHANPSNPVGVRAGQPAASPPRQIPSRRRP
jgi:hypothetical protein